MENHVMIEMNVIIPSNVVKMMPFLVVSISKAVTDVFVILVLSSTRTCNVRTSTSVIHQTLSVEMEIAKISAGHSNVNVILDSSSVPITETVSMSMSVWTVIRVVLASVSTLTVDTVVSVLLVTKKKMAPVSIMTSVMMSTIRMQSVRMVSVTTIPREVSLVHVPMATRKHMMVPIVWIHAKEHAILDQTIVVK